MNELLKRYNECVSKDRCNAFNKEPRVLCSDALTCQLINEYEQKISQLKEKISVIKFSNEWSK